MKKLFLITVGLCFSYFGFAQDLKLQNANDSIIPKPKGSSFQGVNYGVRGGYNISNLDFEEVPNFENKHRNSIYIGFFANIGFSRAISLVPELQFSAEGAKSEPLHLDYIQAPVLLRLRLSEKFHLSLGPQVGLKVHKEDDKVNNFAYSGVGGLEYKINYALFVDARYTYGFRNVFNENVGLSAKNRNVQIGIGYRF
ncbi:PorT family protein [Tamlana fucoidanivorans]|uniref:PorT family protein n=1 Tax=Allotamlana fucoidanivorans TaxID=2583814 RepID=A0A5C4SDY2_9FLAO|nr:porin family protein [Tamlana fucoidanivorans]TNJ41719.1 PorT family protein [Tamlana fucoidanivorans]